MAFKWIGKSEDGLTITLRKRPDHFEAPAYCTPEWRSAHPDSIRLATVIDVETTGLDHRKDKIIEIGLRQLQFNRLTGDILNPTKEYGAFQDPGEPLSPEITKITGIRDDDVRGQAIDWGRVIEMIDESHVIIAHNSAFDRPFIEKHVPSSVEKIWGCSLKQIDWGQKGFPIHKLEILALYHGFFSDAHRALADVNSLIWLLRHEDEMNRAPYFKELIDNARRPVVRVLAVRSPFDTKSALKSRRYNWDNANKFWHKTIFKDELETEKSWLEEFVYRGSFGGIVQEMQITDNFRDLT